MTTKGVILLAFGGADCLDAVEPFMCNLMGGRTPSQELVERTKSRYKLIGGGSPLPGITYQQSREVEKILNENGDFKVLPGMRYWHPFITESMYKMYDEGIREIVALSLSPHFSRVSTGAYHTEIERVKCELGGNVSVRYAEGWYEHPFYIAGLAARINETLADIPEEDKENLVIIFSAHSLPVSHIKDDDSYTVQLEKTVSALEKELPGYVTKLAYQSKGGGGGEWLGPEVEEVLAKLSENTTALVVPIGFACDHIETLYDIDIAQRRYAEKCGIKFYRTPALNTSPMFMECLADVVKRTI
jgi:ferrochelatase